MINILVLIVIVFWIFALVILLWQFSNLCSVFFGSPYVSGGRDIIEKSLRLAKLKKGEVFYDLGCGKADALVAAAGLEAKATGFEISPYYYLYSKIRTLFYPKIYVRYQNIKNVDLRKADVVYCYLLPEFLEKLAGKFKKELKKSARLVSISFKVPGLKLVQKKKIKNKTTYIYQK